MLLVYFPKCEVSKPFKPLKRLKQLKEQPRCNMVGILTSLQINSHLSQCCYKIVNFIQHLKRYSVILLFHISYWNPSDSLLERWTSSFNQKQDPSVKSKIAVIINLPGF